MIPVLYIDRRKGNLPFRRILFPNLLRDSKGEGEETRQRGKVHPLFKIESQHHKVHTEREQKEEKKKEIRLTVILSHFFFFKKEGRREDELFLLFILSPMGECGHSNPPNKGRANRG